MRSSVRSRLAPPSLTFFSITYSLPDDLVRRRLAALKDPREIIADPEALLLWGETQREDTGFETWLSQPAGQVPSAKPQPVRKAG